MSILVISDIHGSYQCLQKTLNTPFAITQIILVGDSLYHGPRNPILDDYNPGNVADLLNEVRVPILGVRGNCDAEVDQMLLDFPMMQDYTVTHFFDKSIYITHGHLMDPQDANKTRCDLFISGHTHLPGFDTSGQTLCLNPGSISLPKGNHPQTYALIDQNKITIYTLDHQEYLSHSW